MYVVVDLQGTVLAHAYDLMDARIAACKQSKKQKVAIEKSGVRISAYLDSKPISLKDLH